MDKNKNSKRGRTVVIVGICLILVTALIVGFAVISPAIKAKSILKEMTAEISDENIKSATVYDPDFDKDLFNDGGAEQVATEEELSHMISLILKITDKTGYSSSDTADILSNFDYRLRFRTSDGKALAFFFSDGNFFVAKDGVRYFFTTKSESAYAELQSLFESMIKPETP